MRGTFPRGRGIVPLLHLEQGAFDYADSEKPSLGLIEARIEATITINKYKYGIHVYS